MINCLGYITLTRCPTFVEVLIYGRGSERVLIPFWCQSLSLGTRPQKQVKVARTVPSQWSLISIFQKWVRLYYCSNSRRRRRVKNCFGIVESWTTRSSRNFNPRRSHIPERLRDHGFNHTSRYVCDGKFLTTTSNTIQVILQQKMFTQCGPLSEVFRLLPDLTDHVTRYASLNWGH